ncbi:MAG: MFS transporter, partial [Clostridiales Family XIII bacterium]|nr:MFS transporter [Clostridiales Family XIII bacterium]
LRTMIKTTFGNKYVLLLSLSMALAVGSTNIRASAIVYYFNYYLGREDLLPLFFLVIYGSLMIGMPLIAPVSRKFGRRNTFIVSLVVFAIANSSIFLAPQSSPWVVFVANFIGGIATAFTASLPLALMPDAVDFSQWKYGARTEGVIFSFNSFASKVAMAIGGGIPAYMLSLTGYMPGAAQSPEALKGIAAIMSVVPGAILLLSALVILFYDMNEEKFSRIVADLKSGKETP